MPKWHSKLAFCASFLDDDFRMISGIVLEGREAEYIVSSEYVELGRRDIRCHEQDLARKLPCKQGAADLTATPLPPSPDLGLVIGRIGDW